MAKKSVFSQPRPVLFHDEIFDSGKKEKKKKKPALSGETAAGGRFPAADPRPDKRPLSLKKF